MIHSGNEQATSEPKSSEASQGSSVHLQDVSSDPRPRPRWRLVALVGVVVTVAFYLLTWLDWVDSVWAPKRPVPSEWLRHAPVGAPNDPSTETELETTPPPSESSPSEVATPSPLNLIELQPGTFQMGSPTGEPGRDTDETLHEVTISQGFTISQMEITQGQYFTVMGERPVSDRCSNAGVGDELPVVCIVWMDAVRFCNRLSTMEGLESAYVIEGEDVIWNEGATGYRLPTEAEWEYAARAGTRDRYAGTNDVGEVCNYANVADAAGKAKNPSWTVFDCDDGFEALAPVGSKLPNAWQLYDMTGNAWEWVWDFYGPYPEDSVEDPRGPERASNRVLRGGSWAFAPRYARVAVRLWGVPSRRYGLLGFRVARSLPSTL